MAISQGIGLFEVLAMLQKWACCWGDGVDGVIMGSGANRCPGDVTGIASWCYRKLGKSRCHGPAVAEVG